MPLTSRRLRREQRTIDAMIALYCRDHHRDAARGGLCDECTALADYARLRLEKCPFGEDKPTCAKCPIHCYKPKLKEQVRAVMRYSGPRMLLKHPILAIRHMLDSRREAPEKPRRAAPEPAASSAGAIHCPSATDAKKEPGHADADALDHRAHSVRPAGDRRAGRGPPGPHPPAPLP